MDINITIPSPVLIIPQYFVVMYRLVGSPTWINITPKTNAPFTISGLAAGVYQLWSQVAEGTSPEILCPERIDTFTVADDTPCLEYELEIVQDGDIFTLVINYTLPSPLPPDLCGITVYYGISGGPTLSFSTTNLTGQIILPASNNVYTVQIFQNTCNGRIIPCVDEEVSPDDNPCTPSTLISASLAVTVNGWFITLTITQSTPYTNPFSVAYAQYGVMQSGVPDPGGVLNLAATPSTTTLTFQVFPNLNVTPVNGIMTVSYFGNLADGCRFSQKWQANFDLT